MRFLFVKPHLPLKVARKLHALLHLEPLELEIVAGGVGDEHDCSILDLSLSKRPEREFERVIAEQRPDVIGFTAYSNQAKAALKLAEITKNALPECVVLIGGVHATIVPEYFAPHGDVVDFVVRGEGGSAMRSLLPYLENGGMPSATAAVLPVASAEFAELASAPPPSLPDYSEVPRPRRDLVDSSNYHCVWVGEPGERVDTIFPNVATVRTSTGCPHRCSFCVVHYLARGKYVQRSPEEVVDEIASLDQNHVYFVDDEMFINPRRVARIAELLLERGVRKKYVSWARSDTICDHPELFKLWKRAGLSTLYVGMESMSEETLEDFNKGYAPDVNRRAVEVLSDIGICLHAAFMTRPEFDAGDFIRLRREVEGIGAAEVTFTLFSPPPGTPLWEEYKDQFCVEDPYSFYDCMHTILPLKLPMNVFYRYFSLLSLFALRQNPWRARKVKVPWRDLVRMFVGGMAYGWALRNIHRDYPGCDRELEL